jgi:hypothetical protein
MKDFCEDKLKCIHFGSNKIENSHKLSQMILSLVLKILKHFPNKEAMNKQNQSK